jgi:hypothetical protein
MALPIPSILTIKSTMLSSSLIVIAYTLVDKSYEFAI